MLEWILEPTLFSRPLGMLGIDRAQSRHLDLDQGNLEALRQQCIFAAMRIGR
jgi:hypothetical protein